jgi:glycosyltransferase involved in cell wall biosynthesis
MGNPEACRRNRSRQAGTRNIPDLPASPSQLRDPMHILFVNPHLTRYQTEAGTWARQLVKDLRAAQTTVTTIPEFSDEDRAVTGPTGGVAGRVKGFVQERLPMNWVGLLIELALFFRAVRNTARCAWAAWRKRRELSADVVYARTYEYDWTPWLVASILKCPMVLEVHAPFHLERRFRGRGESRLIKWFDHAQWRRAAFIRVVSKPVVKLLRNEGVNPDGIRFIPYGVDAAQPDSRKRRSADDPIQIIFVGSFYPYHGVEQLLAAFAMTRPRENNLRLCLVGDGWTRPACENMALELRIEDSTEFVGWLPRATVAQCLLEADIAAAPFLKLEPFYFDPVKVLEYMAAGLPVIASNIKRIAEMLDFGRAGMLVPPRDAPALAEAIITLAKDAQLRRGLGENARRIIEQGYSRKIIAQNIVSLCREAAAMPKR